MRTVARLAVVAAACVALTGGVAAGFQRGPAATFVYPRDLTEQQLRLRLQSSSEPTTILFQPGTYVFSPQLYVYNRSNLALCGNSSNPGDVVIESAGNGGSGTGAAAILLEQAEHVSFRSLTIRGTAPGGQALRLNATLSDEFSGFVDDVLVDRCRLEAPVPVIATAAARNLTLNASRIQVGASDSIGVLWGDGEGLQISGSRFTTAPGVSAFSAVFVQGASVAASLGERTAHVLLTGNRVRGDFVRGFDLADVLDARVTSNRISFTGDVIRPGSNATGGVDTGRVGVLLRRGDASGLPEDFELRRNRVRNALYGVWLFNAGGGVVDRNDFQRCGSPQPDDFFNEYGGGVRLTLQSANCRIRIERNDFRRLRSPDAVSDGQGGIADVPAVVVLPGEQSDACFADGGATNRLSRGRVLYVGAP